MTTSKSRLFALAAAHAATLFAVPTVLRAQASEGLEEIIVTARQREERIQDVPVTITAFTETEIRNAGIERPQDFIALTPGVSVVQTAEVGDMQVNIRGINTGRDAETNFALVVDGVLQTNPTALNQELAGVTQIEVLKGPQGALYGRNAVAGALIVTTRSPGEEWLTDVGVGFGSDDLIKGNFYVGGPISDNVGIGVGGYMRQTDGQWKNLAIGCDDCTDYFDEFGFNGRIVVDELAGAQWDFKARYSEIDSGAINFNAEIALVDVGAFPGNEAFYGDPNQHNFRYINNVKPVNEQENLNLSAKAEWDVGLGTLTGYIAHNRQDNYFLTDGTSAAFSLYALDANCRASNDVAIVDPGYEPPFFGVPSNLWFTPEGGGGSGFLPPYSPTTCDGYQYQLRDQTDTSMELRLSSPGDQRLRWLGGVYFADIERDVVVSQGSDNKLGFQAQSFVRTGGPNPTDLLYDDTFNSTVYAVFGQLAFDVLDNLELALALRYDSEDREVKNNVPVCTADDPTACRAQTPLFSFGSNPYINPAYTQTQDFATDGIPNRDETFDQLQPKISVNWNLNEDFAVFGSYGYGFRSGGFNSSGSAATVNGTYGGLCLGAGSGDFGLGAPVCGPDSVRNITGVEDSYDKEVSKAAELGFKSFFLDRSLSINAAIFQTDVEDMQFFNFFAGPFGLLRVVTNIDEVSIQGAEVDFRWRVGDHFSVFGGYSFLDGEIDRYDGRPYTEGNEVPYAPEYTGNVGADFSYPMGSALELRARVDASFVGETWFHPVQGEKLPNLFSFFNFGQGEFSRMVRDPYTVINLRVGVHGEHWGVTAWGRNVGDEEYLQEIIPAPEFGGSFIHDSPGDSYGIDLNYRF